MLIGKPSDVRSSEITDEYLYRNRRQFLKASSLALAGAAAANFFRGSVASAAAGAQQAPAPNGPFDTKETPTPYEAVTTYNNYYEFGVEKDLPAKNSGKFKPSPWTINVEGMAKKP